MREFLAATVMPWLDGSFQGNGFLYDATWGGLVTLQGLTDFGFGIYNDHHHHLGYFLYTIAVLARLDPTWGHKYAPQAYAMVADFMTVSPPSRDNGSFFTRLWMFDLWTLHSWAGGLAAIPDGRNQESTSEAVNAYYSAALVGLSYGDARLASLGVTLAALEMLWANKRDSVLWFAPAEWRECRLGIQLLPLLPISEALFPDVASSRNCSNLPGMHVFLVLFSRGSNLPKCTNPVIHAWKTHMHARQTSDGGECRHVSTDAKKSTCVHACVDLQ